MTFLNELLAYNQTLRGSGFSVAVGHQHNENDSAHFIYIFETHIFELHIPFEPTDFTEWNRLQNWVKKWEV